MAIPSARLPPETGSAPVWHQLDAPLRHQAISGVAQMACNLSKTQAASSPQEGDNALAAPFAQAPP
jgi:hypothetical protein